MAVCGAVLGLMMVAAAAAAQYQPIPNFTGIGAGYNFRQAINQRFSGATAISPRMVAYPYASLPSEQDGRILWCSDCVRATPCAGGGSGAWAFGARGQWACGDAPLEADLNANGKSVTGALGVWTKESGDMNFREGLLAGTGIQVGNGTSTPFTVIDENAKVTGSVNRRLNVEAPPYAAKGDGATDDAAAIQSAYDAAATQQTYGWDATPTIYLPATPGDGKCYLLSKPLVLWGSVDVIGAGRRSTFLCPNFWGPDILQQYNKNYVAPLTANVTAAWQASHSYSTTYTEIADSNGKIEYVSTAGTSGASAPAWCTTGLGCTTTDGTVTWTQGPSTSAPLLTGTGSVWDASDTANAFSAIVQGLDLNWNPGSNLNGLGAATVEFIVDPIYIYGSDQGSLFCTRAGNPEHTNLPAVCIQPGASNDLNATMDIGGSQVVVNSTTPLPLNAVDDIALTYDGSTARLYLNGTMIGSTAASGNIVEGSYERALYPAGDTQYQTAAPGGYYGSLRISNVARYTGSSYTPTTSEFTQDGNTLVLLNFPVPPTVGSGQAGYIAGSSNYAGHAVFYPLDSSQSTQTTSRLSGFDYCGHGAIGNGLYANWAVNSDWDHLSCSGAPYIGFDLNENDYQVRVTNVFVYSSGPGNAAPSPIGFFLGTAGNNNTYIDLQADGAAQTSFFQYSGYGTYIDPMMTGRGASVYNFVNIEGTGIYIDPFTDIEGAEPNFRSSFYLDGTWSPVQISNAQLNAPAASSNPGDSFLSIYGGAAPVIVGGTFGGGVAEIVNVLSNPVAPMTIREAALPTEAALTNSGASSEVQSIIGGRYSGVAPTFGAGAQISTALKSTPPTLGNVTFAYAGNYNFGATNSTSMNIGLPSGTANGDLLNLCLTVGDANNTLSCPTGFTSQSSVTDGSTIAAIDCTKTASGETGPYTLSWTNTPVVAGATLQDWKNVSSVGTGGGNTSAATVNFTLNAMSGTNVAQVIATCVGSNNTSNASDIAMPSGETLIYNSSSWNGLNIPSASGYYSGPSSDQVFAGTYASTWAGVTMALNGPAVPISTAGSGTFLGGVASPNVTYGSTAFANLGTAVNGEVKYCNNCDPPANPPVACTSSGTKTGAFAHGLNGSWICAP